MLRDDKDTALNQLVLGPVHLGARPKIGLRTGLPQLLILSVILSIVVHVFLALFFMGFLSGGEGTSAKPKQTARPRPETVTNVELWGEVPQGPAPTLAAPPAEAPQVAAPTPPQNEIAETPPDIIPLGPKAEPSPPPLKRTKTPPPKIKTTPPKVNKPQPKPMARPAPKTVNGLSRSSHRLIGSPDAARKDSSVTKYFNQFLEKVQRKWVPKGAGIVAARPKVWYRIVIDPNGRITNVIILQPSGNPYFDRSVEVAIRGVSPLPPLPASFGGERAVSEFGFSPARW